MNIAALRTHSHAVNRRSFLLGSAAMSVLAACGQPAQVRAVPVPPVAKKIPKTITQLGRTREDEYQWIKDARWQEVLTDPTVLKADVHDYLTAENAYADAMMADTTALRDKMFEEMKGRIKQDDSSVPAVDGSYAYLRRYVAGQSHPLYARTPREGGAEEILLDANPLAAGKAFYRVGQAGHSPDHKLFAYAVDDQGSEVWTIHVKDIATGEVLPGSITEGYGGFAFSPDSAYLFWVWREANGRPAKIFRRPARGGPADDVMVYEEKDIGKFLDVGVSSSGAFIMIYVGDQETSEFHIIPASAPTSKPRLFAERKTGELYTPVHFDGRWYILTNAGGAVDMKIVTAPVNDTKRSAWKEFSPHQPGRYIEGLHAFSNHLVRLERANALPRIVIRDRTGGAERAIEQTEAAFALGISRGYEFETPTLRYTYESPATPPQTIDYNMTTGASVVKKTQEVPSGHDAAKYKVERFTAKAADGAEVPVTVLRLANTKLDGAAPLLLYGYGSYGSIEEATFDVPALSLVDRGWIWATAHVRGGAERGGDWFAQGRKDKKKNSFSDFIAVGEDLVAKKYASRGRIVGVGRSAGGLLVGGVIVSAPDGLFGGYVAGVPFVDVINTMSDVDLPLTPTEWPEWGNPLTDPAAYDYMMSYSPYDNLADRPYPPILCTGGLSDPRVTYWEPAKFVARLRDRAPRGGPYLLSINMTAGHSGGGGRFDRLKDDARDGRGGRGVPGLILRAPLAAMTFFATSAAKITKQMASIHWSGDERKRADQ
jgi:oligopeptidase B